MLSLITMMEVGSIQRGVYVVAVALAVAVSGLILAISAVSAARRAGTRRPRGATAGVLLGVLGSLFSGLALIGFLVYWTPLMTYGNCLNGAGTVSLQNACQRQFDNMMGGRMTMLSGH